MFSLDELRDAFGDRYVLDTELSGDMLGQRILARTLAGDPKIITVLDAQLVRDLAVETFLSTLRFTAHVRHPALLPVEEADRTRLGHAFYVTPFPDGPSARARLDKAGALSTTEVAQAGVRLASALGALHIAGLVHGNVRPDLVYLGERGATLADAGVVRALIAAGATRDTLHDHVQVAPYSSPEQFTGELADARSDVYGLGATLYELMTGKPPFGGRETSTTLASVLADETAEMVAYGVQVPGAIASAVLRGIEKDPEDRWQTVEEFAAALVRAERGEVAPSRRLGCLPALAAFGAIIAILSRQY